MANTCLKPSSQLRVVVWEDVGMRVGAILAPLLWIQEELFILRSQMGPTAGPFMHRLPEILNLENTSLHPS